ncbi:MAG: nucleotidyltransferase domain-containing protein [Betaproteobacteria bacterium]|nr:nucleotidyltransferase domain-containing protein [Betaproteobacteria bacterium]
MKLTRDEKIWLDEYRRALAKRFPGKVERLLVYGSKARGDAHSDSDIDVLLVVKDEASGLKREMRRIGYLLAVTSDAVPSIMAYTHGEWAKREQSGSPFRKNVERDAVSVL